MDNNKGIYWFDFTWYREISDEDIKQTAVVVAHDYSEAVAIIESDFSCISNMTVECIADGITGAIYLPYDNKYLKEMISNENGY